MSGQAAISHTVKLAEKAGSWLKILEYQHRGKECDNQATASLQNLAFCSPSPGPVHTSTHAQ